MDAASGFYWALVAVAYLGIGINFMNKRKLDRDRAKLAADRRQLNADRIALHNHERRQTEQRLAQMCGITELQAQVVLDSAMAAAVAEYTQRIEGMKH